MPGVDGHPPRPRRGRRPAGADTRGTIVDAARDVFAAQGYDATSLRAVARHAHVDPALVHHYFGGKSALFAEVMRLPLDPRATVDQVLDGPPEGVGRRLAQGFFEAWDEPGRTPQMIAVLRAAASHDAAAAMLRDFLAAEVFGRVAAHYSDPGDATLPTRVGLAAAQMVGVAMLRYVLGHQPLVEAPVADLVDRLAPVLQGYLVDGVAPGPRVGV